MGIRTPDEYRESVRDGRVVYCQGEKVEDVTTHPWLRLTVEQCAMDYILAQEPEYRDLFVTKDERGEPVSSAFIAAKSAEDLLKRRRMIQVTARTLLGHAGGAKFTGIDGLSAIGVVCRRMDKELGTGYTERVEAHRQYLQKNDLAVALAMTDVKGDRSLRPSKQERHKDYYVRIVEERSDGIVVRGAKSHITYAPAVNEIFVLPCRNMPESDKDYAVAFAIPANAKGVTLIGSAPEAAELGDFFEHPEMARIYRSDATIIFDDVFVPSERVFLKKEWQFSADMAYMFANFHRLSADAYKYAMLELLTGAAVLAAEANGVQNAAHIRDKISWLVMYTEATEVLGKAACQDCVTDPSGVVYPNPMYSNIAKFFFADNFHQAIKIAQDIAGGAVSTLPSSKDFLSPVTGPMLEKYFGGRADIPAGHRARIIKLIKDLTTAEHGATTIHGEGSLAAQRMSIYALADWERYRAAARRATGISDGSEHPAYSGLPAFHPER